MIAFWAIAAVLILTALAAVIPALAGRGQEDDADPIEARLGVYRDRLAELKAQRDRGELTEAGFAEARAELEAELASELPEEAGSPPSSSGRAPFPTGWGTVALVAIAVPLLAVGLYLGVGRPELLSQPPATQMPDAKIEELLRMPLSERIPALEAYLEGRPRAGEAWFLLARSYRQQERYNKSVDAFRRARELMGDQPELLAGYAEALTLAGGGGPTKRAASLAERALEQKPDHQLALWLAGAGAMKAGAPERAARLWRRLARQLPADGEGTRLLKGYIARAEGVSPGEITIERESPDGAGPTLTVRVHLAPSFRDQARSGDTVFIFARSPRGTAPLAAVRREVADLPTEVMLSDAQAMRPGRTLSQADRVVVGARVSRSGQPEPASGDLQGLTNSIPVEDGRRVELTIDRQLP